MRPHKEGWWTETGTGEQHWEGNRRYMRKADSPVRSITPGSTSLSESEIRIEPISSSHVSCMKGTWKCCALPCNSSVSLNLPQNKKLNLKSNSIPSHPTPPCTPPTQTHTHTHSPQTGLTPGSPFPAPWGLPERCSSGDLRVRHRTMPVTCGPQTLLQETEDGAGRQFTT